MRRAVLTVGVARTTVTRRQKPLKSGTGGITMNQINGYKVFNPDWTCKGFQYEVGKTYEMEEEPVLCNSGFHFCERALDCFNYYSYYICQTVSRTGSKLSF